MDFYCVACGVPVASEAIFTHCPHTGLDSEPVPEAFCCYCGEAVAEPVRYYDVHCPRDEEAKMAEWEAEARAEQAVEAAYERSLEDSGWRNQEAEDRATFGMGW